MTISQARKADLEKQGYRIIGNHSAIKLCGWTRQSLRECGSCYKQQFYGIDSHRCCQMTPAVSYCHNKCIICWRPVEHTIGCEMKFNVDKPKDIIENAPKLQKKLLSGFGGNNNANKKKPLR